ncbi:hypothetical protein GQ54DRAFT_298596 [Martensiomyces pterosporus]|nr:hypothetical protein GQ54DRAFT_298596 [Martensiomyces pterosporus]
MAARAGGLIPMLGSGSSATTVESIDDYVRQLQRNILTPLRDLQPNSITSVLLVIATFDPPVQSKGTDYVLRIRGVDPTLNCGEITACTIFRKNKETMPKIRSAGDIILLDSRLLWCYIVEPEKIYEFPQLQVNKIYRFRGCMVTKDPLAGMRITVVRDRFYSDRKVVYSVLDSHQGLRPLLKRRAKCIQQQQQQQQLEQQLPLPPTERGSVDYTNSGLAIEDVDTGPVGDTSANSAEIASAEPVKSAVSLWGALATPISLILGSQEINLRYRIQAKVLSVYPKELGQTFVAVCKRCQKQLPPTEGEQQQQCPGCTSTATGHRECRFIMEVADQSASCLVVCRGSEAARLLGQENGKAAQSTSGALCRFWDPATTAAATIGDEQVVDLCVASMLLPGPGPNAGSLVRCLMVVDAVL